MDDPRVVAIELRQYGRIAWDDDDDDVLDVLGLDSKWFGLRIRMGLVEASYACIIDMPIEVQAKKVEDVEGKEHGMIYPYYRV
ncbi:hypothetical protein Tco_0652952 [Tanacetum coccineum]|uniref:Uncharacterized protein n=1 Tax=Tanacetum coccineum TaxID=301880 RepID=A0ABQ4WZ15_9ASTR